MTRFIASISLLFLFASPVFAFSTHSSNSLSMSLIDSKQRFFNLSESLKEKDVIIFFMDPNNSDDLAILRKLNDIYDEYDDYWDIIAIGIGTFDKDKFYQFVEQSGIYFHVSSEKDISGIENFLYQGSRSFFVVDESKKVVELDANTTMKGILRFMAERTYQKGNYDIACFIYQDLLDQNEADALSQSGLGYCNLAIGNRAEAKEWFESLVRDGNLSGHLGLAYSYFIDGDYEFTRSILSDIKAQIESENHSMFHLLLGELAWVKGNTKVAREAFLKATRVNEEHMWIKASAYNMLGLSFVADWRPQKGLTYLDKALRNNHYMVEAISAKASIYMTNGQLNFARKGYEVIQALYPGDVVSMAFLRELDELEWFKANEKEKARVAFVMKKLVRNYLHGESNRSIVRFDPWTSMPIVLYYTKFSSSNLHRLDLADGFGKALYGKITRSGRIKHVPSYKIREFKNVLGLTSDTEDNTENLAMSFGSHLIMSGSVKSKGMGIVVKIEVRDITNGKRVFDDEVVVTHKALKNLDSFLTDIAWKIHDTLTAYSPIQGKIALVDGKSIIINLGERHGIENGMELDILNDVNRLFVRGTGVTYDLVKVGKTMVTYVERDTSFATVLSGSDFKVGDRLRVSNNN